MPIIVVYHSPCLDGAFSALSIFLYLKFFMEAFKDQDFLQKIFLNNDEIIIDDKLIKEKIFYDEISNKFQKMNLSEFDFTLNSEFLKTNCLSEFAINFLPINYCDNKNKIIDELLNLEENSNSNLENSIIIFLDYFGETLENLIKINKMV